MEKTDSLEQIIENLTSKIKKDYYNTSYISKILHTSFTSNRGELRQNIIQVPIQPMDISIITSDNYYYQAFFENIGFNIPLFL